MKAQIPEFSQNPRFLDFLSIIFLLCLALCAIGGAKGESVKVSWDANPESDIGGYTVCLGTTSGNYDTTFDVGNTTNLTLPSLSPSTTYFCAVQAYNLSGLTGQPSTEVSFTISSATFPEIAVTASTGLVFDGGSTGMNLGTTVVGSAATVQTLTITNQGNAPLTGLGVLIDGANAGDFSISSLGDTLAPGASSEVAITFIPTALGPRDATLAIASNDADENPLVVALTGTGTSSPTPEISITSEEGSDLQNGSSSLQFGSLHPGVSGIPQTITIRNVGTAGLSGLGLSVLGGHASDFVVSSLASSSLSTGLSSNFTITFRPTATGARTAVLRIASTDADENPFEIALSGTGLTQPEIAVTKADGTDFVDGVSSLAFGATQLGEGAFSQPIVIKNTGNGGLAGLAVTVDGAASGDFVVSSLPGSAINPGSNSQLTILFQPTASGLRTALLHILSNDADESSFDLVLSGTGVAVPRIEVLDADNQPLSSTSPWSMGTTDVGLTSDPKELAIHNVGSAGLEEITASVSGLHASDFIITSSPTPSLAPGGSTGVSIVFTPTASGLRSATLTIHSNAPNRNSIQIPLIGTAAAHPRIAVSHPDGTSLTHGATALEFGSVDLDDAGDVMTCSLANSGTADLTNIALTVDGMHAADFEILTPAPANLTPGQSATFAVRFTPAAASLRKALLNIASNDSNRGTLTIPLTGTGVGHPELEIALDGQSLAFSPVSPINFGSANTGETGAVKAITIRNTGTAMLSGLKVSCNGRDSDDFRISTLSATSLKPGASTSFKVIFHASGKGRREAMLSITSSDEDLTSTRIPLVGTSVAVPKLDMKIAGGSDLTEKRAYISLSNGGRKNLVITNRGNAPLTGLNLVASGMHIEDFKIGRLNSVTLAPGKSATVSIRFKSGGKGTRWAALKVLSNDPDSPLFELSLIGIGPSSAKSARIAKPAGKLEIDGTPELPTRSTVTIDGKKYRCITIPKTEGRIIDAKRIEVSSNLVEWNSGRHFTTVIKNNELYLKVRDNTPIAAGEKRHIRYHSGK